MAAIFQGIANQHGGDGEESKRGQETHFARIFLRLASGSVSQVCAQDQPWSAFSNGHQIGHSTFGISFGGLAEQPSQALLHHIVWVLEQEVGQADNIGK